MSLDSTKRFSDRADAYAMYRPGYPDEVLIILEREAGLTRDDTVADVASGTGLLTRLFLKNGNRVFAVEPNEKMRALAEGALGSFANFVSVNGTAEHTSLPRRRIDLISVGQALHWFDPEKAAKEFHRISKPGGRLCIVYNERDSWAEFTRAYQQVARRHGKNRARIPKIDTKYASQFFEGGVFSRFVIPNEQTLTFEGLLGRFLSASYMPSRSDTVALAEVERDVRSLFDSYGSKGRVRLPYRTKISIGRVVQA